MSDLLYPGPHDNPDYPTVHLTCADGGRPHEASEIVIHDTPENGLFIEFYYGPGYLGQRHYLMNLDPAQAERLRAFGKKWWAK